MLLMLFSVSVIAEENILEFDLSVNNEHSVSVPSGTTVTVTFKVTTSADVEEYDLNSIQNEIKFDESFFSFVKNSLKLVKKDAQGSLTEKFAGKRVYMNGMNTTYKKEQTVGTFDLRVIATSGSGKVESTLPLAYTDKGAALSISCTDLVVSIASGSGDEGGGSSTPPSSGGSGGGGGAPTPLYTKDIFGKQHKTHTSYINGYPDGTVKPDGNITREEIAAVLFRIKGYEEATAQGSIFPDVEKERWSADEIERMTTKKIIMGYPDGTFKPSANLTRAEFAALIHRFAEIKEESGEKQLSDLVDTHWAYDEIKALCDAGLIQGYEDGSFRPDNHITRAEVMTVINKILGRKPLNKYVKTLNINPFSDLEKDKWYYSAVLEATISHGYTLDSAGYEIKWEILNEENK